jgi:hypothetical protein
MACSRWAIDALAQEAHRSPIPLFKLDTFGWLAGGVLGVLLRANFFGNRNVPISSMSVSCLCGSARSFSIRCATRHTCHASSFPSLALVLTSCSIFYRPPYSSFSTFALPLLAIVLRIEFVSITSNSSLVASNAFLMSSVVSCRARLAVLSVSTHVVLHLLDQAAEWWLATPTPG